MIFFSLLKNNFSFIQGMYFENRRRGSEKVPDVLGQQETLDENPTLTTQTEKNELSDEILKGFTHTELLSKTHNERLQYVTQERLHGNKLASGEVMSFTFKFFEQENSELYMQTTAGQVIPAEISKIQSNNIIYTRIGTQGEFFAEDNKRLAIHDGTRIDVIERKSSQDIENEIVNFEVELAHEGIVKYETTEDGQEEVSKDFQVALEAKKRGIDISLALLLCDNQENIEHALTDVARIAGNYSLSMNLENGKHADDLALKVLKNYFFAGWKEKARAYGVSSEVVEEYGKKNEYVYKGKISAEQYMPILEELEQRYGVPVDAIKQLVYKESKWNPEAIPYSKKLKKVLSSAKGLGQMIDGTWADYGKGLDRKNPADQLEATARYMSAIKKRQNCSWKEVLAYYNTGEGIMKKVSHNGILEYARVNSIISNRIPGVHVKHNIILRGEQFINKNSYFNAAVSYYNDIPYTLV